MLFTLRGKKRMQEMKTVACDAGEQFLIIFGADAVEGQDGVLTISYGGRTAHKFFQTSPIIGRSEPSPSWRGLTELIYNNGLKYCMKRFGR